MILPDRSLLSLHIRAAAAIYTLTASFLCCGEKNLSSGVLAGLTVSRAFASYLCSANLVLASNTIFVLGVVGLSFWASYMQYFETRLLLSCCALAITFLKSLIPYSCLFDFCVGVEVRSSKRLEGV